MIRKTLIFRISFSILLLLIIWQTFRIYSQEAETREITKNKISELELTLAEKQSENAKLISKISELETKLALASQGSSPVSNSTPVAVSTEVPKSRPETETIAQTPNSMRERMMEARINSISKFVTLDESQKKRLRTKFETDFLAGGAKDSGSESLEAIIGNDAANFYQEERRKSFERAMNDSIEKEVLFIARRLSLNASQEDALRNAYFEAEREVEASSLIEGNSQSEPGNRRSRMQLYIEKERKKDLLISEKLRNTLDPQQYEAYLEYQTSTGSSELEVWH